MLDEFIKQLNIDSDNITEIIHSENMQILCDCIPLSQFVINNPLSYIPVSLLLTSGWISSFISLFVTTTKKYLDRKFKYIIRRDPCYGNCIVVYHENDNNENFIFKKHNLEKIKKLKCFW